MFFREIEGLMMVNVLYLLIVPENVHKCAFHCFDGSCPKCSAFVTRIFNQICVVGDFRKRIQEWKGHCYEMFRAIVMAKFEEEFVKSGATPSIGNRSGAVGLIGIVQRRARLV
uniref:Uncharacterized protein n=1 Tax=Meloidogyne enterolobii TaxID=390850 RepID=A0A6V7Y134_MELEN|nr:unnamed protein product [Meloidogyne enterolobii]